MLRKVGGLASPERWTAGQGAGCHLPSVCVFCLARNFDLGQSDQKQAGSKSIANICCFTCIRAV